MTVLRFLASSFLLFPASAYAAGTCVGPVWIDQPRERAAPQGPDFTVAPFRSAYGPVHIYEGCCSEVTNDRREFFVKKDEQSIYRTFDDAGFSGYLTIRVRRMDGSDWHHQAHFFGAGLKGDERDLAFFDLVRLGSAAEELCKLREQERG